MKNSYILLLWICFAACNQPNKASSDHIQSDINNSETSAIILGIAQDGGYPHIACKKDCCKEAYSHPELHKSVVSIGIIDRKNKKNFLLECTPDFAMQAKKIRHVSSFDHAEMPDGIFLTHAHIGHYSGLMYLGKEAMNAMSMPVYSMPRMKQFLENNGPWSQLVHLKNIDLRPIINERKIVLTSNITVTPIIVPHRDEFSETVGYIVAGPHKKIVFIPDIDKWEKWNRDIIELIQSVDYAFIDGTFYDGNELNHRSMDSIPHPFIVESMNLFKNLSAVEKNKIYFIHFNHTNPALNPASSESKMILKRGFHVAETDRVIAL